MRFTSAQDYYTMLALNRELINVVADTPVIIYKVNVTETKTNIYGENTKRKRYYTGVRAGCFINISQKTVVSDIGTVNSEQVVTFAFLRTDLKERDIYIEVGDIIEFNNEYYEVNNTNEIQLYAGQVIYNHQILCDTHLTRIDSAQLEKPLL